MLAADGADHADLLRLLADAGADLNMRASTLCCAVLPCCQHSAVAVAQLATSG